MVSARASDSRADLVGLAGRLGDLRRSVASASDDARLAGVHPRHRASAANLLHYVALRRRDIRDLQGDLAALGLSSLGRAEAHVLATIDAVHLAVASLAGLPEPTVEPVPVDFATGDRLLDEHSTALLGESSEGRRTRIMVTLSRHAAEDPALVHDLMVAGSDMVHIRCADNEPAVWAAMIDQVRDSEASLGRTVRVTMDLPGRRPLTGPVADGPRVLHIQPPRDAFGRVTEPVRLVLAVPGRAVEHDAVPLPVRDEAWLRRRVRGEKVTFSDARGIERALRVVAAGADAVEATLDVEAFLVPGAALYAGTDTTTVGDLPGLPQRLTVRVGDDLHLVRDLAPADPRARPARIGCTVPEVLDVVSVGDRVFFDDGAIGAVVSSVLPEGPHLRVTDAAPGGSPLRSGVRVNLPDSVVDVSALTDDDVANLPFVVTHADTVALSFVRTPSDVARLQSLLADLGAADRGLILKIETPAAFAVLPDILLTAMRSAAFGVMIARGDLALETGYVRLAEVQEEILWLCEAAHVPVIWATDVLDTLARTGRPSRAEVTDASASGRAEAVMLSDGPYAVQAVAFLSDLLTRMSAHQHKKSALLRQLRAWDTPAASRPPSPGAGPNG